MCFKWSATCQLELPLYSFDDFSVCVMCGMLPHSKCVCNPSLEALQNEQLLACFVTSGVDWLLFAFSQLNLG